MLRCAFSILVSSSTGERQGVLIVGVNETQYILLFDTNTFCNLKKYIFYSCARQGVLIVGVGETEWRHRFIR